MATFDIPMQEIEITPTEFVEACVVDFGQGAALAYAFIEALHKGALYDDIADDLRECRPSKEWCKMAVTELKYLVEILGGWKNENHI